MSGAKVISIIIAVAILLVSLPILETALVDAGNVSGASTNFTTAVTISELVLGFVPIGLLLWFLKSKA
tara:strand:+ start:1156 stop:1359 length:204 start_codon:yes stop_codon:yes gene_type:complete